MKIKEIFAPLLELFFPRICPVCGELLSAGERGICSHCRLELPMTRYIDSPSDNELLELFYGRVNVDRVVSFFYYDKLSPYANIVRDAKFRYSREALRSLSEWFAARIKESGIFDDIDIVVAVPLHPTREQERGYNQADIIAETIAEALDVDMGRGVVIRSINTTPQAAVKSFAERIDNVARAFKVSDVAALSGRHILIVDDVITTGSTTLSLAKAIESGVKDCKISICSLSSGHKRVYR